MTNSAYEPIPPWYTCIPPLHAELATEVHIIEDWSCQLLQTCQHAGAVYKVLETAQTFLWVCARLSALVLSGIAR